jgi:thioredoxin 1
MVDMQTQSVRAINGGTFEKEVLQSDVPVVVDFYADWCGPCKAVSPILEGLSSEYAGRVSFVKVNVDDNQELSSNYGIMSIPTVLFIVKGNVQSTMIGAAPAAKYKEKVERALSSAVSA